MHPSKDVHRDMHSHPLPFVRSFSTGPAIQTSLVPREMQTTVPGWVREVHSRPNGSSMMTRYDACWTHIDTRSCCFKSDRSSSPGTAVLRRRPMLHEHLRPQVHRQQGACLAACVEVSLVSPCTWSCKDSSRKRSFSRDTVHGRVPWGLNQVWLLQYIIYILIYKYI